LIGVSDDEPPSRSLVPLTHNFLPKRNAYLSPVFWFDDNARTLITVLSHLTVAKPSRHFLRFAGGVRSYTAAFKFIEGMAIRVR
jgi:hypothetical protein